MLQIGKVIVSFDVIQKEFVCDLRNCKGACCIDGDSGAPLEESELKILNKIYKKIKPYLRAEGIEAIEKDGFYTIDSDGDFVTTLVNNKECVYIYFDMGVAKCSIEKAYFEKKIKFRKPISCHLYPIRINKYNKFDAVNYHRNKICNPALLLGSISSVPLYRFLEESIARKYGNKWYQKLKYASENLEIVKISQKDD